MTAAVATTPSEGPGFSAPRAPAVSFAQAARFWLRLGWINFGGPAGQIALMHRELVVERRWIDEPGFLHALNFCMLLPGPEAMQLAIYVGWLLHGTRGAIVAGIGFCLPAVLILLGLSYLYAAYGELSLVAGVLAGFKPVVVAIILLAMVAIARRSLRGPMLVALALAAFVCIRFLGISFPVIVLTAALVGALWGRTRWGAASAAPAGNTSLAEQRPASQSAERMELRSRAATLRLIATWVALTAAPAALMYAIGENSTLMSVYAFFTKAAYVTFGGAYAVLAYVNEAAVQDFAWLTAAQSMDGFALAETTPGPLIIVLQFVGFLAGWNHPGDWTPLGAAIAAALLTSYATFLPSFFFVVLGAPYVETLRGKAWLAGALSTVTAAVVGVILNLGLVFASAVFWPGGARISWFAVVLALGAGIALWKKVAVPWVVLGGGLIGLATHVFGIIQP
jgi:chromate transporter